MEFMRRFGLRLAVSLFTLLLLLFTLALSGYMVLDKPATVKTALARSGTYDVIVDNVLTQKQQQLGSYLPVDNPAVRQAVQAAFSPRYLQATAERNIDATYAWIHGVTHRPNYSADLDQPKAVLAQHVGRLVEQKLASLPACKAGQAETPTTVAELLNLQCRPTDVPTDYFVRSAEQGISQSNVFDQVVRPVLALQDEQGRALTDSLEVIPKGYKYFVLSLYLMPAGLLLLGLAILFWSISRRRGLAVIARGLAVTGVSVILFSLAAVWMLGKGAQWASGSNNDLVLIEGKMVDAAQLIGGQLRNWLIGFGGVYLTVGIGVLIAIKLRVRQETAQNIKLNASLGYSNTTPEAGTTFDPQKERSSAEQPVKKGEKEHNPR